MGVIKRLLDIVYETLEGFNEFQLMGLDQQAVWAMSITSQVIAGTESNIEQEISRIARERGLLK